MRIIIPISLFLVGCRNSGDEESGEITNINGDSVDNNDEIKASSGSNGISTGTIQNSGRAETGNTQSSSSKSINNKQNGGNEQKALSPQNDGKSSQVIPSIGANHVKPLENTNPVKSSTVVSPPEALRPSPPKNTVSIQGPSLSAVNPHHIIPNPTSSIGNGIHSGSTGGSQNVTGSGGASTTGAVPVPPPTRNDNAEDTTNAGGLPDAGLEMKASATTDGSTEEGPLAGGLGTVVAEKEEEEVEEVSTSGVIPKLENGQEMIPYDAGLETLDIADINESGYNNLGVRIREGIDVGRIPDDILATLVSVSNAAAWRSESSEADPIQLWKESAGVKLLKTLKDSPDLLAGGNTTDRYLLLNIGTSLPIRVDETTGKDIGILRNKKRLEISKKNWAFRFLREQ